MFNILVIGDTHFKSTNVIQTNEMCNEIYNIINNNIIDLIVLLGDMLHNHENAHSTALKNLMDFFLKLTSKHEVICLVGNHDLINHSQFLNDKHSLNVYKPYHNLTIVDKVITKRYGELQFTFVPYVDCGRFEEAINTVNNWKKSNLIFAHQEFKGSYTENQKPSTCGDKWSTNYPTVITGHIHKPQVLKNVIYTGTPIQHTFGEDNDKKIDLVMFDSNDKFMVKHIKLNVRQKIKISVDIQLCENDVYNYFYKLCNKKGKGHIYKIVFNGYIDEIKGIKKKRKDLNKLKKEFDIRFNYNDVEKIKSIHEEDIKYIEKKNGGKKIIDMDIKDVVKDLLLTDFDKDLFEKLYRN